MEKSLNTKSQRISDWIKNYAQTNNINSLVVGISGGIDSALVSTLCAMTQLNTYCVSMPIRQPLDQLSRAHDHIDWLKSKFPNVSSIEIDLTDVFNMFEHSFTGGEMMIDSELAFSNSRSRLRMTALYQVATSKKGIVVGTGNKVEDFGVGFFTKYGDGGVDISPIADLTKTEVRELSRSLGISHDILVAPPTDGLWKDGRTDEDQIGATYPELEWAMDYLANPSSNTLSDRETEILKIYNRFHTQNHHKMIPIPIYKD